MKKSVFALFTTLLLVLSILPVSADVNPGISDIRVSVDGEIIDAEVVVYQDRTLLPARAIVEALGGVIGWDADTRTVTITKNDINIALVIDSPSAIVNGETVQVDEAVPFSPIIFYDRTYLPVRFLARVMDVHLEWNEGLRLVSIDTQRTMMGEPISSGSVQPTEPTTPAAPTVSATYYWTPGGGSHHSTPDCHTLARSTTILSGTLQEALDAGKTDPCDNCIR